MRQVSYAKTTQPGFDVFEPQWLSDVKSEIAKRLGDKITVGDLAEIARMSDLQLVEQFKQENGVGLARYIHLSRLSIALGMLHETGLPLAEIAIAVGFGSSKHMSAVFQKDLGTPPGELRRFARCIHPGADTDKFSAGIIEFKNTIEPKMFRACGAM